MPLEDKLSKDEKKELEKMYYAFIPLQKIAKRFKTSDKTLNKYLKKENIQRRKEWECYRISATKYNIDHNFFDEIDTEEKAYILGILYADGCNHEKSHQVELGLSEKDKDILIKINKCLHHNKPLQFIDKKVLNKNWSNVLRLVMVSKNISEKLSYYGCMSKKTFKLTFPNFLRDDLKRHFIRGYFDGDGSLSISKKTKSSNFDMISTESFCLSLKKIFKNIFDINSYIGCRFPERNNNIRSLKIGGNKQVTKIMRWLYEDSTIFLERKYNKYLELVALCKTLRGCNYV